MAVFLLRAGHGSGYVPPPASGTIFTDVAASDFAADWIEELYAEGITGGCATSPLRYCPNNPITRGQMAAFLLKVYHGTSYAPPPAQGVFSDVAITLPLAPWIEELARLSVTAGCGGSAYCPSNSVTRGQMAVFMSKTFHRPEAIRFLEQATWGPSDAEVGAVLGQGFLPWLAAQNALPASSYPDSLYPLWPGDTPASCDDTCYRDNYTSYRIQNRFFTNALYQPDQLRQRVAWALHKIVVVSEDALPYPFQMAPYLRVARPERVRQLPGHPLPGDAQPGDGRVPEHGHVHQVRPERELRARDHAALRDRDGAAQPGRHDAERRQRPPALATTSRSSTSSSASTPVGTSTRCPAPRPTAPTPATTGSTRCRTTPTCTTPTRRRSSPDSRAARSSCAAGQTGAQDLNQTIDAIFNHPNVGPYLARELIHSLVTSNPSHEYVERVAGAFNDNGSGVRGSLWAMVKAILLDPEARREPTDPIYGHLKEPVLYINNVLRAFHAMSEDRTTQSDGNLEPYARDMGQKVWKPPTVFSYYPQFYAAPPASAGLLGPEFGIMNSQTSLKRANFVNQMTIWGGIAGPTAATRPTGPRSTSPSCSSSRPTRATSWIGSTVSCSTAPCPTSCARRS